MLPLSAGKNKKKGKVKVLAKITGLLKELRRRNVFKVGVTYAIVAWLIIQVFDDS
jgi:hypothetical protein